MPANILQLCIMGIGDRVLASGVYGPSQFPITLGRDPSNTLHVLCEHISRFHAAFRLGDEGLDLVDLGSFNGTRVGNRRIAPHVPHRIEHPYLQIYFGPLFAHLWHEPAREDRLYATGVVGPVGYAMGDEGT